MLIGILIDQIIIFHIIILPTMGFTKLDHDGDEYWVGPENQILARVKEKKEEEENLLLF